MPLAQRLAVSVSRDRTSEVLLRDANGDALVLRQGDAVWSLWNIPESLALLLGEGYLKSAADETRDWLATWRPAQQLYYRLPSPWRSRVQKRMIRGLDDKLAQRPADQFATRYPIDATGWLLLRAIRNLIRLTGGDALPSLDPWPNGSRACVVVSQDIEPTRYAYRRGLPRLLNWLQAEGTPPHTINVVGNEARREPKLWNRSKFNA